MLRVNVQAVLRIDKMLPPFQQDVFTCKFFGDNYTTQMQRPSLLARWLPSLTFYTQLFAGPFFWLCRRAAQGQCDDSTWNYASLCASELIEKIGGKIVIEGMNAINAGSKPCVFVANHMSTLETFMLPGIIRPRRPVTFVVKRSLVEMPFFGAVMRSRNPVVVDRKNPREDLTVVLTEGVKRLQQGISVIIFPQSTRAKIFEPQHFNTIGEKLARRAGVDLVPLALKADAWGSSKYIKDLGKIRPELTIHYRFASPIRVTKITEKEIHSQICAFILQSLREWSEELEDVK